MRSVSTFITILATLLLAAPASAQWSPVASGTSSELRGLVALGPSVVWASGTRGRVLRSADGGRTWRVDTVAGAERLDLRSIAVRGAARGTARAWVASAGPAEQGQARIFATKDGTRWSPQFAASDSGVFLDAIAFWDDRHGIALSDPVGGALTVFRTDDGGVHWRREAVTAPPMLAGEAAFAASGTCMIVRDSASVWIGTGGGSRARVFRSADRGRTWTVADTPVHAGNAASGIFSIAFSDARHGVVVGGEYTKPRTASDNIALTSDGGRTWRLADGPLPAAYLSGVAYLPGTAGRDVVAVGLAGTARSTDGGESWTMIDTVAYNSVVFASATAGWAAGPRGRVAVWIGSTHAPAKP